MLALELGYLKKVSSVAVDGSKIQANASKHTAISYKRAEQMIQQLELEIEELTCKAKEKVRDEAAEEREGAPRTRCSSISPTRRAGS